MKNLTSPECEEVLAPAAERLRDAYLATGPDEDDEDHALYFMINMWGLGQNGGIGLYDQQFTLNQSDVSALIDLGLHELAKAIESHLAKPDDESLDAAFWKHENEMGNALVRKISAQQGV